MITVMIIKANANDLKVMIERRKTRKEGQEVEVWRNTVTGTGAGVQISTKDVMNGTEEMIEITTDETSPATMIRDLKNRKTRHSGLIALHGKGNCLINLDWQKIRSLRLELMEFR